MKLSALAAQIKSCGHCEVINNGGRIFVGTGSAFYCMDGYPRTQDAGELGAMLGIPQKKMKNILISWGGDDVARDSGAGLLLDVPPVAGGDLVYFLVKCCHGVGSFWF